MKLNIKPLALTVTLITTPLLTGCIGSNAVTEIAMGFNLKAVDNRYARGGLNMLMAPIYGLTIAGDYLIFNSLEFWTGKNIINGKPHIFDKKVGTFIEVNGQLDESLKSAPIDPLTKNLEAESGLLKKIDDDTIQMEVTYHNGDKATITGIKNKEKVTFYYNGEVMAETSISELEAHTEAQS